MVSGRWVSGSVVAGSVVLIKPKENACKSNQYQVENCPALPGRNLISTCNRRVKSVSAERVEISSRQSGIM